MGQAKTLTDREIKKVLDYIAVHRYASRNRAIFMTTVLAGLRISEVAALRCADAVDANGSVRNEIRLSADQTKGGRARTVFVSDRLRKELTNYVKTLKTIEPGRPLFRTQKREGFTANTLCQLLFWLYRNAGVDGASSHSGRRTLLTRLASKGVGVRVLAEIAGHADISVTQKYIDVNDDMKRRAVELF